MTATLLPVLRIVHYSDLHIASPKFAQQHAQMKSLMKKLPHWANQGLECADTSALREFVDFLADLAADQAWKGLPLWLVDTGDGTTFGDADSLDDWRNDWSNQFLQAAGSDASQLLLYGNHDAWPQTYPLLAPANMDLQRKQLRAAPWFSDTFPAAPLTAVISGPSQIQLYALNSVDHRLLASVKAAGRVDEDRFWEKPAARPTAPAVAAAQDLKARIAAAANGAPGVPHFRILAMHYPVCDKAIPKRLTEVLANRRHFADEIKPPAGQPDPVIHLLLAGHTHTGYPVIGAMPSGATALAQPPLELGQLQLVTPSLSQVNSLPPPPASASHAEQTLYDFPHQCTVLQVHASVADPLEIILERRIAGRDVGGVFGYLPLVAGSQRNHETISFVI